MVTVSPDVLNPRSDDLERAYAVETFDRMIVSPVADQEEALRLLLAYTPNTKRDPDKYIAKPQPMMPQMAQQNPQKPNAPIIPNKGLPQNPAIGQM
jgi:hypothetical protein